MAGSDAKRAPNRLVKENSPYLLRHAYNPVDWYPWGAEAFEKARREDKPVFLSVGYSSCHWCHVMEQESFDHPDMAEMLNRDFVCVKIDREERPDLDEVYMLATQLATGRGGWPNSVWLRPDGKPWYAGTYFPREDRAGIPGLRTVLTSLAEAWRTRREEIDLQAARLWAVMQEASSGGEVKASGRLSRDLVTVALGTLERSFDGKHGGFGEAPKFPPHTALRLLLYKQRSSGNGRLLRMATRTLDGMAAGGIRDHLGGGFHRYSTDERWFTPHFEKMLYDNAQLARAYADGYAATGEARYRRIARETYDWMLRDMIDKNGGFQSSLDADSDGEEGRFYVWTREEIQEALGDEADLFCKVYGVQSDGNWSEEAGGKTPGTNILYMPRQMDDLAKAEGANVDRLDERLTAARTKLLTVRGKRVPPPRDDKILTSWNGLAIGALAHGGRQLGEKIYVQAAERAADFVLGNMRSGDRLLRYWREGQARLPAYLEDYVFLADGLLDLHEASGSERWLREARTLADTLVGSYRAEAGGFYFTSDEHEGPDIRTRDPFDQALPSANGVAAQVLLRLAAATGEARYREEARKTLDSFLGFMEQAPGGTQSLILAAAMYYDQAGSGATADASETRLGDRQATPPQGKPVTARTEPPSLDLRPGEAKELAVTIAVADGLHLNSNHPLQGYLLPTQVLVDAPQSVKAGQPAYPEGKLVRPGSGKQELSIYEGETVVKVPILTDASAHAGESIIKVQVRYQACSDRECLPPAALELSVPLRVSG